MYKMLQSLYAEILKNQLKIYVQLSRNMYNCLKHRPSFSFKKYHNINKNCINYLHKQRCCKREFLDCCRGKFVLGYGVMGRSMFFYETGYHLHMFDYIGSSLPRLSNIRQLNWKWIQKKYRSKPYEIRNITYLKSSRK